MKIAIASGKGGVGKSMLASSLSFLLAEDKKIVACDGDVDAPNLDIWLGEPGNWETSRKISVSERPVIKDEKCEGNSCQKCVEKCRFGALEIKNNKLTVNPFLCEGCGACRFFCSEKIGKEMRPVESGDIKSKTVDSFKLVSGQLRAGETGSGKVVTEVKKEAEKYEFEDMIIDSAAGTGCPVIASLQGVDKVILVTEPTLSGISDLEKVLGTVNHFELPYQVIINKWDINSGLTDRIVDKFKDKVIGKISYDKEIFKAVANLTPVMETNLPAAAEIKEIYKKIL